jgi:hypothetical protein
VTAGTWVDDLARAAVPRFRVALALSVAVVLVVGSLEWRLLGWPILPPLTAASVLAILWWIEPTWPRTARGTLLSFLVLAPVGAWSAFLGGERDVLAVPIFDTAFAIWILTCMVAGHRIARSTGGHTASDD